nr:bifunctional isocitrate dehydrogenase kinase/phosphatase [Cytophagales bacterium]
MCQNINLRQFYTKAGIGYLLAFMMSCSGSVKEEESVVSDAHGEVTYETLFVKGMMQLDAWTSYWEALGMNDKLSAFEQQEKIGLESHERPEVNPLEESGHPLRVFQIDHPSGLGTVDIYHYKLYVDDEDAVSFQPDSEVTFYRENGMRERLLFMGPSGMFEDAVWIDNTHLIVVGYFEHEDGFSPMVWIVDIKNSEYQLFESDLVISDLDRHGYLKRKLSGLEFAS